MRNDDIFKLSDSSSLWLNFLRGFAAQAVVVGHGLGYFGITSKLDIIQNSAVVAFFILSGVVIPYSIFGKISTNREYGFFSYFIDRFFRIYTGFIPALFMVLGVDLLSKKLFGNAYPYSDALNVRTFLGNILMLQDHPVFNDSHFLGVFMNVFSSDFFSKYFTLFSITSFGSARPFWTVAVEWWIYLLVGWIVLGKKHREKKPVLFWFTLVILLIVPTFNWVFGGGQGLSMVWFMGFLVYIFLSRIPINLSRRDHILLISFFLVCALIRLYLINYAFDGVYAAMLALVLFLSLSYFQQFAMILPKIITSAIIFNADISYSLYLIHYTLLDILLRWRGLTVKPAC